MQIRNDHLSIGKASKYLGVSIDTLRRWEKAGKLAAHRSPGGHRYFLKTELDKVFGQKYERYSTLKSEESHNEKDQSTIVTSAKDPVISHTPSSSPNTPNLPNLSNSPKSSPSWLDTVLPRKKDIKALEKRAWEIIGSNSSKRLNNTTYLFIVIALILFTILDVVLVITYLNQRAIISPLP